MKTTHVDLLGETERTAGAIREDSTMPRQAGLEARLLAALLEQGEEHAVALAGLSEAVNRLAAAIEDKGLIEASGSVL